MPATFSLPFRSIAACGPLLPTTSLLLALIGCDKVSSESEPNAAKTAQGTTGSAAAKPSARTKRWLLRPLVKESARAELDTGGVVIDFGTADQHKYTRGGWRTGWGQNQVAEGASYTQVTDRTAKVWVDLDRDATEIALRARSATQGQSVTFYIDGKAVKGQPLTTEWSVIRVPATQLKHGRHQINLAFNKAGAPRAEIDWLWLPDNSASPEPMLVPRVMPLNIGGRPKRALVTPTPRRYSFYLQAPKEAVLIADIAADKPTEFSISAKVDGSDPIELYQGQGKNSWEEIVVDLAPLAGRAARLDLVTKGEPAKAGWGEPELSLPSAPVATTPGGKAKNVIFVLIDTVRADSFSVFADNALAQSAPVKNGIQTPSFDALAKKSTVFRNAYNQENWTKPSVATSLSGTYPSTHDTKTDGAKLPAEVELLSENLQKQGFATAGFVANGYVSEKFGFERGWDTFKNYIRLAKPSEAKVVYGDSLDWLKTHLGVDKKATQEQGQPATAPSGAATPASPAATAAATKHDAKPFFLYIQTIDPHVVYRVEREFSSLYYDGEYNGPLGSTVAAEEQIALGKGALKGATDLDLSWLRALYWGEVTYHDKHMGEFLAELERLGVMDNTLLVVTNDHGEELGDHGKFGHGHSLFEELVRAPLMFHFPAVFAPGVRTEIAENVDVAQTIVDVLGKKPLANADGTSLVPLVSGKPVQQPSYSISEFLDSRRASRVGDFKLIISAGNYAALYNVEKDFGEKEELTASMPIAHRMVEVTMGEGLAIPDKKQRLRDITTKRQFQAGKADIDPVMRKQLEALGYFGK